MKAVRRVFSDKLGTLLRESIRKVAVRIIIILDNLTLKRDELGGG